MSVYTLFIAQVQARHLTVASHLSLGRGSQSGVPGAQEGKEVSRGLRD